MMRSTMCTMNKIPSTMLLQWK